MLFALTNFPLRGESAPVMSAATERELLSVYADAEHADELTPQQAARRKAEIAAKLKRPAKFGAETRECIALLDGMRSRGEKFSPAQAAAIRAACPTL